MALTILFQNQFCPFLHPNYQTGERTDSKVYSHGYLNSGVVTAISQVLLFGYEDQHCPGQHGQPTAKRGLAKFLLSPAVAEPLLKWQMGSSECCGLQNVISGHKRHHSKELSVCLPLHCIHHPQLHKDHPAASSSCRKRLRFVLRAEETGSLPNHIFLPVELQY